MSEEAILTPPPEGTSMPSSIVNLFNTGIGSGILIFPVIFTKAGLLGGLLIILFVSSSLAYTNYLLVKYLSKVSSIKSYEDLIFYYLPHWMAVFVSVTLVFGLTIACAGFLIIIGDSLDPLVVGVVGDSVFGSRFIYMAVLVVLLFPLTLIEKVDRLKFTSVGSSLAYGFLCVSVIIRFGQSFYDVGIDWDRVQFFKLEFDAVGAIPLVIFSYMCNLQLVPIFQELQNRTINRGIFLIVITFCGYSCLYLVVSLSIYFIFYEKTEENLLLLFGIDDILLSISRIGIAIATLFTYPLISFPLRLSVDFLLSKVVHLESESTLITKRKYIFSVALLIITYSISILVQDLVNILSLVSSLLLPVSVFLLPGVIQIKHRESILDTISGSVVFLLGLGCYITFLTLFV